MTLGAWLALLLLNHDTHFLYRHNFLYLLKVQHPESLPYNLTVVKIHVKTLLSITVVLYIYIICAEMQSLFL